MVNGFRNSMSGTVIRCFPDGAATAPRRGRDRLHVVQRVPSSAVNPVALAFRQLDRAASMQNRVQVAEAM